MLKKLLSALILSAALAAACGPALAGKAPEAADTTQGMAMMSAVVDVDGRLHERAGVLSATLQAGSQIYVVKLARPAAGCVSMASPLTPGVLTSTSVNRASGADTVHVSFFNPSGTPTPSAFELLVFCSR